MQTVLVIDQQADHNAELEQALHIAGYKSIFARCCQSALALATLQTPDAVLLDVDCFDAETFHTLSMLKLAPQTANVPVILSTPRSQSAFQVRALWKGAQDYVTKPIDTGQLTSTIRALTQTGRTEHDTLALASSNTTH